MTELGILYFVIFVCVSCMTIPSGNDYRWTNFWIGLAFTSLIAVVAHYAQLGINTVWEWIS